MDSDLDDFEEQLRQRRERTDMVEYAVGVVTFTVLSIVLVLGYSYMLSWEYEECIKVGHGEIYCEAQVLGCFGNRNSR